MKFDKSQVIDMVKNREGVYVPTVHTEVKSANRPTFSQLVDKMDMVTSALEGLIGRIETYSERYMEAIRKK